MCHGLMVCHGDRVVALNGVYTEEQAKSMATDCKPATFYVTNDGKYALDADFVSLEDIDRIDLDTVPKIALKP